MLHDSQSSSGAKYKEVVREGVVSCLRAARVHHDPADDWDGFVQLAADEILSLFEPPNDEVLPAHLEEAARRYLEKSRGESER